MAAVDEKVKQIMALRAVSDAAPNPRYWPRGPIQTARSARILAFSAGSAFSAISVLNPVLAWPRQPRSQVHRTIGPSATPITMRFRRLLVLAAARKPC